jgi:uncharacterized protein Yka (UPF0111/DUF47 family)
MEKKDSINSEKKSCTKEIFESITGCKHPLIASGATPIRSASLAPDEINTRIMKLERQDDSMLEPILKKLSTIASGATTIGSCNIPSFYQNLEQFFFVSIDLKIPGN